MPHYWMIAADMLLFAVLIWNVIELGGIARFACKTHISRQAALRRR